MFTKKALCVSLSTSAVTNTLSFMISPHRSKARFVVMMVDFVSALSERWLKSSSPASLSHETYPNSSQTTRSYFLKRPSYWCRVFADLHSLICVMRCGTDVKSTCIPSMHAFMAKAVATCVFPVPGFP